MSDPENEEADPSARASARFSVRTEALLRRAAHNSYRVAVHDVSLAGCKVDLVERPDLNERVWIKLDGLESLEATVCWIDGFVAGLRFASPLHPAVLEQLVRTHNG